jgi:imidazolonepropionase
VPREYADNRGAFIKLLCDEIMPTIAKEKLSEFCDIFCETAVFSIDESREILKKAAQLGYKLKAHVDEIDPIGGAELAAELSCLSAEHLIAASDEGIKAMSEKDVIAVLLPATSFYLGKPYARARKMIDEGVAVAVATDFNPGSSPNLNMQFPMNLACLYYRLNPAEVLTAVTLNAAAAIDRADTIGSIELGKKADLVVWNASDLDMIFYRYGTNQVKTVVKDGVIYKINNSHEC